MELPTAATLLAAMLGSPRPAAAIMADSPTAFSTSAKD